MFFLKIWYKILSALKMNSCIAVPGIDYWTGDMVDHYVCSGKKWRCRYHIKAVIDGMDGKGECLRSYNTASDDYIRCGNDDAVRDAVVEKDVFREKDIKK